MRTFNDAFQKLSDESLLKRVNQKDHFQREAVLAAFHVLVSRGYRLEYPYPDDEHVSSEAKTQITKKSLQKREYHSWIKRTLQRKSTVLLLIFVALFAPLLWYSNSYLKTTDFLRHIYLSTETILPPAGVIYIIDIILVLALFFNTKSQLTKFLNIKQGHLFVAFKVFFFSLVAISVWEWLFSSRVTISHIFDAKSAREILKSFWFGGLVAFTEELIFKWLLLSQLLIRSRDSSVNRRLIFVLISILFAVAHMPIEISEYGGINFGHLTLTFFYSYFTSILYVKHRNFLLVVGLHFFANISSIFIEDGNRLFLLLTVILLSIYCIPKVSESWLFNSKMRLKLPVWILPGAIAIVTMLTLFTPKQPNDYFNYSKEFYSINSYDRAFELVNLALLQDQSNSLFLNHKGNIFYNTYSYDSAWSYYNKAVEIDSVFYRAVRNRGLAAKQISKYEECIDDLTTAVMQGIQTSRVYQTRGSCYLGIEEPELAISDFKRALNEDSTNDQAYYGLGRAYLKTKDYDKALESLTKSIAIDPNSVEAYEVLSMAYTGLKRYDSSNATMTKAIEMGSTNPVRFYLRGLNYYEKGDYYSAIKEFEKSIEFNPTNAELFLKLAFSSFFLEDYDTGCEYLKKSASLGSEQANGAMEDYCDKE